ncbi:hypothetical protein EV189_2610 [Motilibacter rhizosphaerae]|uniref:Uncharacterized protein n=1 Tax=Motilibacter rhizosphaerae TaxID=598652 RepID=A0A4Q7NQB0_9ACTN|nr:hypothetical protein [Motilibacter rhizosphaerae]RZS87186.1 hypothetical protein EV189_2610 [Motilibacter rhizosphaerae]
MLDAVALLCRAQDLPVPGPADSGPHHDPLQRVRTAPADALAAPALPRRQIPMLLHEALALAQCRPTSSRPAPSTPHDRHRRELLARRRLDLALRRLDRASGEVTRLQSQLEASV